MNSLPPSVSRLYAPDSHLQPAGTAAPPARLCGPSWRPPVRLLATGAAKHDPNGVRPGGPRITFPCRHPVRAHNHAAAMKPLVQCHRDLSRARTPLHAAGCQLTPTARQDEDTCAAAHGSRHGWINIRHPPHSNIRNCR